MEKDNIKNNELKKLLDESENIRVENNKELTDTILKFLENPKLKSTVSLTNQQVYSVALLTTLAENIKEKVTSTVKEIRDDLIAIRTLMDENPTKAKQLTTNLIKELK